MKIARVFPRRTKATPDDPLVFTGPPPKGGLPDMEEVHVSVAFTYDMEKACQLAEQWMKLGVPVHMGGPAFNMPGGDFVPGMYLKKGYVITSRGCPNRCWFCSVPQREGGRLRELPITEGNIVLDDNLLACSRQHILADVPNTTLFQGQYFIPQQADQPLTEIREGDLYFCLEQRLVTVRDQVIPLTVKEFDIFALLILNPKRVFTYEMLLDLVWHEDYTYYSRKAINNHVSNLRKKIRIAPDLPDYVKSVYGVGYKFDI